MAKYLRLQIYLNLDNPGDAAIAGHFVQVKASANGLPSNSATLRLILERDRQMAQTHGPAWNWQQINWRPPWLDEMLRAARASGVVFEPVEEEGAGGQAETEIVLGEGLFAE